MNSYPAIIVKRDRQRALLNRHPWLFSGAIEKIEGDPELGDIVQIKTSNGQLLAYGFYQGSKTISARLFHFTERPQDLNENFWRVRFSKAFTLRQQLGVVYKESGYRLLFSEGDFVPGLIVDIFGDVAGVQITAEGTKALLPILQEFLSIHVGVQHIYDGRWIKGEKPEPEFVENNLRLKAQVESGQKTGYFFDQRDNRALLKRYAKGKTVLDTFCYSGGFTCNALDGQAKHVTSVDISKDAMDICDSNVKRNGLEQNHEGIVADCFDYLRLIKKGHYDAIVLDPPAFAKSAHAVEKASRGYKDINLLAMQKIEEGGIIFTFSCSQHISVDLFQKIVFGAAKDAGRNIRVLHRLAQASDHPFDICHPEGEYLKGLVLSVC